MTKDAHASPASSTQEALYDVNVATPTHADRARTLVAQLKTGTLSTVGQEPAGYPYGSFVTVAFDEGNPVFLVSELAEHTKNLRQDTRASLLMAEAGSGDPLANGRVTLLGPCEALPGDGGRAREAFLAAHPNSAYYVDFKDFGFWKLEVRSVRFIGGYGRMSWVAAEDWHAARPDPIGPVAAGILSHMNEHHADSMVAYCQAFSKATDTTAATMTGIDRLGFEMSAETAAGPRPIRLAFPEPVGDSTEARQALVALVAQARSRLG